MGHHGVYDQRPQLQNNKKKNIRDDNSSISSRSSRTSSNHIKNHRSNKRFNMKTNSYVTLTPMEMKLEKYRDKYDRLTRNTRKAQNDKLNKKTLSNGELLFSEANVDLLRYSFFESFSSDLELIRKDQKTKINGLPKLRYVRSLEDIRNRSKPYRSNHPRSSESSDEAQQSYYAYSDEEDDYPITPITPTTFRSAHMWDNCHDDGSTNAITTPRNISIRDLFKSNQFLNNVYQDLKYNPIELPGCIDYFQLIPNINQLATFYKEVIDYVLTNLTLLQCDTKGLAREEKVALEKHKYFFYQEVCYEHFQTLEQEYVRLFESQKQPGYSLGFEGFYEQQELCIRQMSEHIILNFIDNFKVFIEFNEKEPMYQLWAEFLDFVFGDLLLNCASEANTTRASSTSHNSVFTTNTKKTTDTDLTMSQYNKPRITAIIPNTTNEPQTNDFEFNSPESPHQTTPSGSNKKKSLFSRFRRSEKLRTK